MLAGLRRLQLIANFCICVTAGEGAPCMIPAGALAWAWASMGKEGGAPNLLRSSQVADGFATQISRSWRLTRRIFRRQLPDKPPAQLKWARNPLNP